MSEKVWQAGWDKPHRCPKCHAVVARGGFVPWAEYRCGECETLFSRQPFLPPYGQGGWSRARCLREYLDSQWHRLAWRPWKHRAMLSTPPAWYVWGEKGPLVRGAARAWYEATIWADDHVHGFSEAVERLYNEEVRKFYAEMHGDDGTGEGGHEVVRLDHSLCDPGAHDFVVTNEEISERQRHAGPLRLCNDCLAPVFYCSGDEWYHHAGKLAQPCFLINEPGADVQIPGSLQSFTSQHVPESGRRSQEN